MPGPKFLSIKNYERYQHYKQRNPPWVKLYKSIFADRAFMNLSVESRYLYIGLLTLASECDNKVINDPSFIAHRLSISPSQINLKPLFQSGLLLASETSIRRYTNACLEAETETETEKRESIAAGDPACALPPPVPKKPKAIKTGWPEGFQFNEQHKTLAEALGLNVFTEFAHFRDKAQANGWTYADWDAAFSNWLRNEHKFRQGRAK